MVKVYGLTLQQVETICFLVTDGNVTAKHLDYDEGTTRNGPWCWFRLWAVDSHTRYARRSAETFYGGGGRTHSVAWQTVYDILDTLFLAYPTARVHTAIADYRGRESFLELAPRTYGHNVGAPIMAQYLGELPTGEDY